jgi:hypothetical protein
MTDEFNTQVEPEEEFDPEEGLDPDDFDDPDDFEDDGYTPPREMVVGAAEYDRERHAAFIHDSMSEKYVDVSLMQERGGAVTILRALGAMQLEPRGNVVYYLNGNTTDAGTVINPGDEVFIVGKLAGGR